MPRKHSHGQEWRLKMVPNLPLFFTTLSRHEHIFITPQWCQISSQPRSFESTFLSPSPGQELIPYQFYLRTSMKKITHISKPDILSPLLQQQIGRKHTVHVWPNFLWVNHSRDGNPNLNLNHKHQHCFQRWIRSNYLSNFQVSVDRFAWCNKV